MDTATENLKKASQRKAQRKFYAANREQCIAATRKWQAKNSTQTLETSRRTKQRLGKAYFATAMRKFRKDNWRSARNSDLKKSFGITLEQYEAMLAAQKGVCACCGEPERYKKKRTDAAVKNLAVDHDHATNEVRDLLCSTCNRILGMIFERSWHADKLAAYLRKWGK